MTAPAPRDSSAPAGDQHRLYGIVRLGELYAALSIEAIREVVPRPAALAPFPATMSQIIGAIELRGELIPVLDLAAVLGDRLGTNDATIVMLLRVEDQLFGVEIDEICGVVELEKHCQTPMRVSGSAAPLVLSGFALGERHGVVLDAGRIVALPGMALACGRGVASQVAAQVAVQSGVPTLMFSLGAFHFGLAARFIEACVPSAAVVPSPVDDPLWIGIILHNGRRVAVVDTLALLGLGRCEPMRDYACVILRMPHGALVGLRIDTVQNILRIRPAEQWPVQGFPVARVELLAGLHEGDELSLLIDGAALQGDAALGEIARLEGRGEGQGAGADQPGCGGAFGGRLPFLIAGIAGAGFAIPLEQVEEILPARARERIDLPAQQMVSSA